MRLVGTREETGEVYVFGDDDNKSIEVPEVGLLGEIVDVTEDGKGNLIMESSNFSNQN